ncbi:8563_t:CDS:2 [Ambispora gerdemannii]|uniref:8563_t:CDS:1 n=1 Tax=Ambispora gerdemannii TaxID=144530 RepID=A0A9N9BAE6_9GLOM|nr:8563_t:CDS:2 [Ambispora gerdemannii]
MHHIPHHQHRQPHQHHLNHHLNQQSPQQSLSPPSPTNHNTSQSSALPINSHNNSRSGNNHHHHHSNAIRILPKQTHLPTTSVFAVTKIPSDSASSTNGGLNNSGSNARTTADERELARKVSHSAIERRRRERINDKIMQLKELIPICADQDHLHKLTEERRVVKRSKFDRYDIIPPSKSTPAVSESCDNEYRRKRSSVSTPSTITPAGNDSQRRNSMQLSISTTPNSNINNKTPSVSSSATSPTTSSIEETNTLKENPQQKKTCDAETQTILELNDMTNNANNSCGSSSTTSTTTQDDESLWDEEVADQKNEVIEMEIVYGQDDEQKLNDKLEEEMPKRGMNVQLLLC